MWTSVKCVGVGVSCDYGFWLRVVNNGMSMMFAWECLHDWSCAMRAHTTIVYYSGYAALLRPPNVRPLLIGMSLMLFQQITGQPSVLYYAASIFQRAGFATAAEATKTAVVLGLFKLLMTGARLND